MNTLMKQVIVLIVLMITASSFAQDAGINLSFSSESGRYARAVKEYQDIWDTEGKRIIEAMENVSGLKFIDKNIQVIIYEGVSWSGHGGASMKLRASYPKDIKKATLIHELGHRLISNIPKTEEIDEHRALFLILYDIWVKLYGRAFAYKAVEVEKERKGIYDYKSAWVWALSLSEEERASKFRELAGEAAPYPMER